MAHKLGQREVQCVHECVGVCIERPVIIEERKQKIYENEVRTIFLIFTFENKLLFWVYHFGNFQGKNQEKGAPISLLAQGARNPSYTTAFNKRDVKILPDIFLALLA